MGTYILPLTKSPHPQGRIGSQKNQDWYRALVKTRVLFFKFSPAKILIISDVLLPGNIHEADIYIKTLKSLGFTDNDIVLMKEAHETIGQIETAKKFAQEKNDELIVVSTFLHSLRAKYLFRGYKLIKHFSVFGIPRPREIFTDIILTFGLPLLDFLGLRNWFKRKINQRRSGGKW